MVSIAACWSRAVAVRVGQLCLLQIPGKLLFVLVKRYLCVTSLMDKLSSGVEQRGEQQASTVPSPLAEEKSHVKQEFEFSMAMANLISELVHVMGWGHSHKPELLPQQEPQPRATRSIFQHRATSCSAAQAVPAPAPKEPVVFKTRSAFPSRSSYVEYVQARLVRGMRVRMLEDYEQVSAGDEGEFRQSNDGTPPVQVPCAGLARAVSSARCAVCREHTATCGSSGLGPAFPQPGVHCALLLRCTGKLWAARTGFTGTWWRSLALQGKRSVRARRRCPP